MHDDHDDDFRSGPPALPSRTVLRVPRALRRELVAVESFRADPIDSLREPPVTLGDLGRGFFREAREAFARALVQPRAA